MAETDILSSIVHASRHLLELKFGGRSHEGECVHVKALSYRENVKDDPWISSHMSTKNFPKVRENCCIGVGFIH